MCLSAWCSLVVHRFADAHVETDMIMIMFGVLVV